MKPSTTIEYKEPCGRRIIVCAQGGVEGFKTRRPYIRHFDDYILNGVIDKRRALSAVRASEMSDSGA